mgnify:CR=1 FL=1
MLRLQGKASALGEQVRVLERRDIVGGCAVTTEFHPGFRNSLLAYTVSLLHPKVIRDLNLARHGLAIVERVPIRTEPNPSNEKYLKTKKDKLGHTLSSV